MKMWLALVFIISWCVSCICWGLAGRVSPRLKALAIVFAAVSGGTLFPLIGLWDIGLIAFAGLVAAIGMAITMWWTDYLRRK